MELNPNEGRVLGALVQSGGSMRPSELRARYDLSEPLWPDMNPDLRKGASAVLNIHNGVTGLEEKGLVELRNDPVSAMLVLRLTELGRKLVEDNG